MKKRALLLCLMMSSSLYAATVIDVPKSDPALPAIETTVKEGYMPLYNGSQFKPANTVTRKELALVIQKMLDEINDKQSTLTKAQRDELLYLSKIFKKYLETTDVQISALQAQVSQYEAREQTLHNDITRLSEDTQAQIEAMKKDNRKKQMFFGAGLGIATLLGITMGG